MTLVDFKPLTVRELPITIFDPAAYAQAISDAIDTLLSWVQPLILAPNDPTAVEPPKAAISTIVSGLRELITTHTIADKWAFFTSVIEVAKFAFTPGALDALPLQSIKDLFNAIQTRDMAGVLTAAQDIMAFLKTFGVMGAGPQYGALQAVRKQTALEDVLTVFEHVEAGNRVAIAPSIIIYLIELALRLLIQVV